MTGSIRQRRKLIIESEKQDVARAQFENHKRQEIAKLHTNASNNLAKLYIVIITILSCLLIVLVLWFSLRGKGERKKVEWLPVYILSMYPSSVSPRKDFTFLEGTNLAIQTPENLATRHWIKRGISLKRNMQKILYNSLKGGNMRIFVNMQIWEQDNIFNFLGRGNCGNDFIEVYNRAPVFCRQDLVLWCWMASKCRSSEVIVGYAPIHFEPEGMHLPRAVRQNGTAALKDGRIWSTSLLVHRHVPSEEPPFPTLVLEWIMNHLDFSEEDMFRFELEKFLYRHGNWLLLETNCQGQPEDENNGTKVARQCHQTYKGPECCDLYLPFQENEQDQEEETDEHDVDAVNTFILKLAGAATE